MSEEEFWRWLTGSDVGREIWRMIVATTRAILGARSADAEAVELDVIATLLSNRDRLLGMMNLPGFVYVVTVRSSRRVRARRPRTEELNDSRGGDLPQDGDPSQDAQRREEIERVREALPGLTDDEYVVICLKNLVGDVKPAELKLPEKVAAAVSEDRDRGFTYQEIADLMRKPLIYVRRCCARATQKLEAARAGRVR